MSPRRKVEEALERVQPAWSAERGEAAWQGLEQRRRRRVVRRGVAGAIGVAAVVGLAMWWQRGEGEGKGESGSPVVAMPQAESPVEAAAGADVQVVALAPELLRVKLGHGTARFHRHGSRRVEVAAGPAWVISRASDFSVARYRDATEVWAVTGPVQVLIDGQRHEVAAGQRRRFADRPATEAAPEPAVPAVIEPADRADPAPARPDWRTAARDGRFAEAYRALRHGEAPIKIADLLLAADVYRLSGHTAEAIGPLQTVARHHSADPRAPLAAFTLGRLLLDDLGRPADAARAFHQAAELDPGGPLAEDALAREVEAWSKAGDDGRARAAAGRYLRDHPNGRRLRAVKQYGGL